MTLSVFPQPSPGRTVGDVAAAIGADLPDASYAKVVLTGVAPASASAPGRLIYIDSQRNAGLLPATRAAAVLCTASVAAKVPAGVAVLISAHPQLAFAAAERLLYPEFDRPRAITGEEGISPAAHVSPKANLEAGVIVEAGATIAAGASIGEGTIVAPNAVIGPNVQIGRNGYVGAGATVQYALIGDRVVLHPGVRIGQDGFGYAPGRQGPEKIPQIGRVIIQDDVEIGANTTVDRGAIADTVIGERTKIDNLVQIGHNVTIGRCCLIAGQVGISGSVSIGNYVMIGGGAGLKDHLTIGDGAQIAARSGLMEDVPAGAKWGGFPAGPIKVFLREAAQSKRNRTKQGIEKGR